MMRLVEEMQRFPWSDSSDEDERVASNYPNYHSVLCRWVSGIERSKQPHETTRHKSRTESDKPEIKDNATSRPYGDRLTIFTELRNTRPVFLRNDHILGEDMLLISAVEEADGYTAVGVELMHVFGNSFASI
jgi:hypothetical protein